METNKKEKRTERKTITKKREKSKERKAIIRKRGRETIRKKQKRRIVKLETWNETEKYGNGTKIKGKLN